MKKNIKIYAYFVNVNNERKAFVSTNEFKLKEKFKENINNVNSSSSFFGIDNNISFYKSNFEIKSIKNKDIYEDVKSLFKENDILVINNIKSEYDFKIYVKVLSKNYNSEVEWINYLNTNNLGEKWINGELSVKINSLYEEYSKDLGSKKKESIVKIDLDSYDKIWNFEDYFKGTESFTNGEYARYWYSTKNTFLDCV